MADFAQRHGSVCDVGLFFPPGNPWPGSVVKRAVAAGFVVGQTFIGFERHEARTGKADSYVPVRLAIRIRRQATGNR